MVGRVGRVGERRLPLQAVSGLLEAGLRVGAEYERARMRREGYVATKPSPTLRGVFRIGVLEAGSRFASGWSKGMKLIKPW